MNDFDEYHGETDLDRAPAGGWIGYGLALVAFAVIGWLIWVTFKQWGV